MTETGDLFKDVNWDEIEAQEDFDNEIVGLRGDYKGEVKDFRFVDTENGGFFSLNAQITETVKGIKGDNRYVSRAFNLGKNEWSTEEENKEKLLKVLKTMGVTSPDEAKGKTVCLKVRPNGTKKDKNGWPKHIVTIVAGFKGATDDANVAEAGGNSKIPF